MPELDGLPAQPILPAQFKDNWRLFFIICGVAEPEHFSIQRDIASPGLLSSVEFLGSTNAELLLADARAFDFKCNFLEPALSVMEQSWLAFGRHLHAQGILKLGGPLSEAMLWPTVRAGGHWPGWNNGWPTEYNGIKMDPIQLENRIKEYRKRFEYPAASAPGEDSMIFLVLQLRDAVHPRVDPHGELRDVFLGMHRLAFYRLVGEGELPAPPQWNIVIERLYLPGLREKLQSRFLISFDHNPTEPTEMECARFKDKDRARHLRTAEFITTVIDHAKSRDCKEDMKACLLKELAKIEPTEDIKDELVEAFRLLSRSKDG
ncbi:MAG: hypothetical protein M1817_000684 [Caeruleum heppii]|nr:MAG: hypothetical protein M1817_000684 [Caeruleum heppii]